jgi:hypothetical protein
MRPKLTIVTAVSRGENLPLIEKNLSIVKPLFDVSWCCVLDKAKVKLHQITVTPNILAEADGGDDGSTPKNVAISLIRDGWIYFLDDDNLIHPNFPLAAREAILVNPSKKCFVFAQAWWDDTHRLDAGPIRCGNIDTACFLLHRSVIAEAKWSLFPHEKSSDFNFINPIWQRVPDDFLFINEVCAYYNKLRPGEKVI